MRFFKVLLISCAFLVTTAHANIFVDRSIVQFEPGGTAQQDIKVINNSAEKQFVEVSVMTVENPGTAEEQRVATKDLSKLGLLATPKQLIVPANSERAVRFVALKGNTDVEQVYRVTVKPILPPLADEKGAAVRVVIAYELLVLVLPHSPSVKVTHSRKKDTLSITNAGNSYALYSDGKACDAGGVCQDLPTRRLYAGNTWDVELPAGTVSVTFDERTYEGSRQVEF